MKITSLEAAVKSGISKNLIFKKIAGLEREFFPNYPYNINGIKKSHKLSNGCTLIAFDKGNVIGYLIPLFFKSKDYLQILTIAVDKKHHKKGYGTELIKKCERIARSLKLKSVILRADVSYPILKTLKN
ncbi:GNAT family N-acetyltransferase [Candidatus Woesearchaeota archaeon]|nr:GNAT family N-acetyltransferase [Candidatus Woesearchaeota archaeon]